MNWVNIISNLALYKKSIIPSEIDALLGDTLGDN